MKGKLCGRRPLPGWRGRLPYVRRDAQILGAKPPSHHPAKSASFSSWLYGNTANRIVQENRSACLSRSFGVPMYSKLKVLGDKSTHLSRHKVASTVLRGRSDLVSRWFIWGTKCFEKAGSPDRHRVSAPAYIKQKNPCLENEAGVLWKTNKPYRAFKTSLIALKFGRSFGVGVCSLYLMTPCLSMTKAARALAAPNPARSGKRTP